MQPLSPWLSGSIQLLNATVTIDYQTVDNSALSNNALDYTDTQGQLVFTSGTDEQQSLSIPITDDALYEDLETFDLQIVSSLLVHLQLQ